MPSWLIFSGNWWLWLWYDWRYLLSDGWKKQWARCCLHCFWLCCFWIQIFQPLFKSFCDFINCRVEIVESGVKLIQFSAAVAVLKDWLNTCLHLGCTGYCVDSPATKLETLIILWLGLICCKSCHGNVEVRS